MQSLTFSCKHKIKKNTSPPLLPQHTQQIPHYKACQQKSKTRNNYHKWQRHRHRNTARQTQPRHYAPINLFDLWLAQCSYIRYAIIKQNGESGRAHHKLKRPKNSNQQRNSSRKNYRNMWHISPFVYQFKKMWQIVAPPHGQ